MSIPNIYPYQDGRTSTSITRDSQMRRDNDTVKVPKIGLYDIDFAIYSHIRDKWQPNIIDNDVSIQVPIIFATGEKWAQIRANGYIRDQHNMLQTPLIAIKRGDISQDDRLSMHPGQVWGGNSTLMPKHRLIPYKTNGMQYDQVSGQYLSKESVEFYLVDVPEYVRISYDLILWTTLQEHMNVLVQGIIPMSNHMWGDFYKFRTTIQSITPDNINAPGDDRIVKTTINLQVDGYLRNEYEYKQSKIQKAYSIKRVKFMEEGVDRIIQSDINDAIDVNIENTANINQNTLKRRIQL